MFMRSIFAAAFPLFSNPSTVPLQLQAIANHDLSVPQHRSRLGYELAWLHLRGYDANPISLLQVRKEHSSKGQALEDVFHGLNG